MVEVTTETPALGGSDVCVRSALYMRDAGVARDVMATLMVCLTVCVCVCVCVEGRVCVRS